MFDALDLEYALLRAAARGSVGPYSFSESLHKLTFTQSLAFPALARGLAAKQSIPTRRPQQHSESGLNAFAKVVTALILMFVSVLVFGIVYKFVRTWGWLLALDNKQHDNFRRIDNINNNNNESASDNFLWTNEN